MRTVRSLSTLLAVSVLVAGPAQAGALTPPSFSCTRNADYSGSCSGTFLGARNNPAIADQVYFGIDNTGHLTFGAVYAGNTYLCSKNSTAGSFDMETWTAAASARNYFYVSWNPYGVCTWVYVSNSSANASLAQ